MELHRVQEVEETEKKMDSRLIEDWTRLKINNAAESAGDRHRWRELVHRVIEGGT